MNGQRAITGDTALRLAHFFGTSAEFWLNLQSLYELRVAQKKTGKAIKALPRLKHSERKRWHVSIVRHRLPYGRGSVRTTVYHMPNTFHQSDPTPSQITRLTSEIRNPSFHQVVCDT